MVLKRSILISLAFLLVLITISQVIALGGSNPPISNATVSAYNTSGSLIDSQSTNLSGNTRLTVTEYINNGGNKSYYSNYTINASKTGWNTGILSFNFTANFLYTFFLSDAYSPELVQISTPQSIFYSRNTSILLNYSVSDLESGINSCWFFVTNSTNSCILYDLNHDGTINSGDIDTLQLQWGRTDCSVDNNWCNEADLNQDGKVDGTDSGTVISHYGSCKIYEINTTIIPSCLNTTFNVSDEKSYTLYLYANDKNNNTKHASVNFAVSTSKPSVNLISPTNNQWFNNGSNIFFNFTATQALGLDTAKLYGNWSGNWSVNYTWIHPTNATMNFTSLNLTDGFYLWNVWSNNTIGTENFALNNQTFGVDTIFPLINSLNITTTTGSQTIQFNSTEIDANTLSCKFSIFDSSGNIEGLYNNLSFVCNQQTQAVVSSYATYNLTIYATDPAGNENSSTKSFTTSQLSVINGGGGGVITTKEGLVQVILAQNFSILTENGQRVLGISLAKGSVTPRSKSLFIPNKGINPIQVKLMCDTQTVTANESAGSKKLANICDYVTFSNYTLTLSPNEKEPTGFTVYVKTPPNSSLQDSYVFNILALQFKDNKSAQYAKISVSADVSMFSSVFAGWRYFFGQGSKPDNEKAIYPLFLLSVIVSILVFAFFLFVFRAFGLSIVGFLIGFILGLISLFALPFLVP